MWVTHSTGCPVGRDDGGVFAVAGDGEFVEVGELSRLPDNSMSQGCCGASARQGSWPASSTAWRQ
jgi:hypothetical protein